MCLVAGILSPSEVQLLQPFQSSAASWYLIFIQGLLLIEIQCDPMRCYVAVTSMTKGRVEEETTAWQSASGMKEILPAGNKAGRKFIWVKKDGFSFHI